MIEFNDLPALLTLQQTTEILGISRAYAYKLLREDVLPVKKLAGKVWILRDPLLTQFDIQANQLDLRLLAQVSVIIDLLRSIDKSLKERPSLTLSGLNPKS